MNVKVTRTNELGKGWNFSGNTLIDILPEVGLDYTFKKIYNNEHGIFIDEITINILIILFMFTLRYATVMLQCLHDCYIKFFWYIWVIGIQ